MTDRDSTRPELRRRQGLEGTEQVTSTGGGGQVGGGGGEAGLRTAEVRRTSQHLEGPGSRKGPGWGAHLGTGWV